MRVSLVWSATIRFPISTKDSLTLPDIGALMLVYSRFRERCGLLPLRFPGQPRTRASRSFSYPRILSQQHPRHIIPLRAQDLFWLAPRALLPLPIQLPPMPRLPRTASGLLQIANHLFNILPLFKVDGFQISSDLRPNVDAGNSFNFAVYSSQRTNPLKQDA